MPPKPVLADLTAVPDFRIPLELLRWMRAHLPASARVACAEARTWIIDPTGTVELPAPSRVVTVDLHGEEYRASAPTWQRAAQLVMRQAPPYSLLPEAPVGWTWGKNA